ncbi:MAG: hypothetical protein QOF47_3279 [Mycobacterium sp.]|nr:hypothetical protein [Mycobacterium sp.]
MTLLRPGLRPVAIVVVARVLIPLLKCRRGGDGLGRRLDRRLDVCLGVGDGAGINSDSAGSTGVCGGGTAATRVVLFVVTTAAATGAGGRTGRRGRGGRGGRGARGGCRCAVGTTCHRQHSRRDGGDADCQRCAATDTRKGERQRNLAFITKLRQDSEIHTCTQATATRIAGGSFRRPCCQPAELTGSIGRFRRAPGASAGTTGCFGGIGASRL